MKKPLIEVAIYLHGQRLRPDYVSKVLNLQPSVYQTKGGRKWNSSSYIAKIGMWAVVAQSDSMVVSDHINELLAKIGTPPTPLDEIEGVDLACLDVFVALDDNSQQSVEITIPTSQLKEIVKLGLCAQVTVPSSVVTDEEEKPND